MLPYIVLFLAVFFIILKMFGIIDDITNGMRRFWEGQDRSFKEIIGELTIGDEVDSRLEVFRDFFIDQSDLDEDA
jgi:hypothetical protein